MTVARNPATVSGDRVMMFATSRLLLVVAIFRAMAAPIRSIQGGVVERCPRIHTGPSR
jgi:hypothetical protein